MALGTSGASAHSVGNMATAKAAADSVMAAHPSMQGDNRAQIGVSNDNDPEKEALQKLVKAESMGMAIPDKLARGANDLVATGATVPQLQRISAVLEAVELRGGADAHQSQVAAQSIPNASAKGGQLLSFA